jgi:hypothetical protein
MMPPSPAQTEVTSMDITEGTAPCNRLTYLPFSLRRTRSLPLWPNATYFPANFGILSFDGAPCSTPRRSTRMAREKKRRFC